MPTTTPTAAGTAHGAGAAPRAGAPGPTGAAGHAPAGHVATGHVLVRAGHAAAAAHGAAAKVSTVPDVSVGHALLQMVLALAVIVGSIVLLSKFLGRLRNGAKAPRGRQQGTKGLTVLSRQSLGKDLSIAAVQWGGREVLVGISGSTITFLNDARAEEPAGSMPGIDSTAPSLPSEASLPFSPSLLAAARQVPALIPAPSAERPSLLEQLRAATMRR